MNFDYVIIGGGSAGCVIASRLSEDPLLSVLLLEAGGADTSPLIYVPGGMRFAIGRPKYDWCYQSEPDPTRNNRAEQWPRGRVLGGSSSINGQIYVRGNRGDFDYWAELGNTGWGYDDVLPLFCRSENHPGGDDGFHGHDGGMQVSELRSPHKLAKVFVDAGIEAGIPFNADVNGREQEGICLLRATQVKGRRKNAAQAFLRPAMGRSNLKVITNAQVMSLDLDGSKVRGVNYFHKGMPKFVSAKKEVVLSAGSIGSPQILMLSGIGPAEHLKETGVTPIRNLPGVGENLREHPALMITQKVNVRTYNQELTPIGILRNGLRWLLTRDGPASTAGAHAHAFIRTRKELAFPDIQIHMNPSGYRYTKEGIEFLKLPAISAVVNVSRPESKGNIRLKSGDFRDSPLIHPLLLDDPHDVDVLISGARWIREIFNQDAFKPYILGEITPGDAVQSDEQWREILKEQSIPIFHPVGTCKMGRDDLAVVGPNLKVHGFSNLRVADASIMPTLVSGNTHAACVMIGEKAADLIRGERM
ncbi:MAG: hypothetical protein COB36_09255 [Alphaproteobacteria bacterium]|nr:MAG: hypothetical protein COB36_09255 [Alphaproteobacteria bacterium]